jgi:SET domain-containing protein
MTSSSSFAIRRSNTGLGLFTLRPIRAGKRIIEYVGPIVTNEVVERSRGKYFFRIDEDYAIDGRARSNAARYINHSCRPNAEAFIYGRKVWIYSKCAVSAGEQITIDYGEAYLNAHMNEAGCKCVVCA